MPPITIADCRALVAVVSPAMSGYSVHYARYKHMEEQATIGIYRIEAQIGAGAHGVIYRSQHPVLHTPLAIKVFHDSHPRADQARERLLDEARSIMRLRHPGIVHLYDVGEQDGQLYLVMELLSGSLRAELQNGPLGAVYALRVARAVAATLAYAHDHGVLHGDLKPENVLLRDDGSPVVADFGLLGTAQTGKIAGSPAYMAPEQLLARPLDGRTDVYALGVMLYEMIAGGPPFGTRVDAAIEGHINERPPQLRSFDTLVPPSVDALVAAMLAKDPDRRPHDMGAVVAALDAELGRRGTVRLPEAPSYAPSAEPRSPAPFVAEPARPAEAPARRPLTRANRIAIGFVIACAVLAIASLTASFAVQLDRRQRASASAAPVPTATLSSVELVATALSSPAAGGTARPRATEVPLIPVSIPIVELTELVDPQSVTLGDGRWSVGSTGVYQDGVEIRVYGLVRNDSPDARRNVDVRVTLRDSNGAELFSNQEQVRPYMLGPGEVAPFRIAFDEPNLPSEGSYSIDYEVRAEPADEHDIAGRRPVVMSDVAVGRRDNDWAFEGRFTAGERTIESPNATAVFLDNDGNVVGIGYGGLADYASTMAPDTVADFDGTAVYMEKQPARVLLLSQGREYLQE